MPKEIGREGLFRKLSLSVRYQGQEGMLRYDGKGHNFYIATESGRTIRVIMPRDEIELFAGDNYRKYTVSLPMEEMWQDLFGDPVKRRKKGIGKTIRSRDEIESA